VNAGAKKISGVRALIFDLDGTLIDSKLDLALSVNAALAEMGRPSLPHEQIFGYVGEGAPMLLQRAMGEGASGDECRRALEFFLAYYRAHMLDNTVTYPGVREGLEQLAGLSMAVLTNKPVRISRAILEGLGLASYFRYIYGGNSFERKKPDPMGTEVLLRDFGMAPREAMIVGDSEMMCRLPATPTRGRAASLTGWAARAWLIFPQTSSWTAHRAARLPRSSIRWRQPTLARTSHKESRKKREFFSVGVVNFAEVMEKLYCTAAFVVSCGTSRCSALPTSSGLKPNGPGPLLCAMRPSRSIT